VKIKDVCYLCDQLATHVGIFTPNRAFAKRIGEPEGKQRVVVYMLCDACMERPDRMQAVEAHLLRELQVH
jgi:hypothetical protein